MINPIIGRAGVGSARLAPYRRVFVQPDRVLFLANHGKVSAKAGDAGNTSNRYHLRPGLLMGLDSNGEWNSAVVTASNGASNTFTKSGTRWKEYFDYRFTSPTVKLAYLDTSNNLVLVNTAISATVSLSGGNTSISFTHTASENRPRVVFFGDINLDEAITVIPDGQGVLSAENTNVSWHSIPYAGVLLAEQLLPNETDVSNSVLVQVLSRLFVGRNNILFDALYK